MEAVPAAALAAEIVSAAAALVETAATPLALEAEVLAEAVVAPLVPEVEALAEAVVALLAPGAEALAGAEKCSVFQMCSKRGADDVICPSFFRAFSVGAGGISAPPPPAAPGGFGSGGAGRPAPAGG